MSTRYHFVLLLVAVACSFAHTQGVQQSSAELTTEVEYYRYGVLHKKDIGCAAEYRKQRAQGLWAFCRYKKSLQDPMYTSVMGYETTEGNVTRVPTPIVCRGGVCLRNAAAIGDVKAVQWLLKQRLDIDVTSKIAAVHLAQRNGHNYMVKLLHDRVIFPDKICSDARIFLGYSLENERRQFIERQAQ